MAEKVLFSKAITLFVFITGWFNFTIFKELSQVDWVKV